MSGLSEEVKGILFGNNKKGPSPAEIESAFTAHETAIDDSAPETYLSPYTSTAMSNNYTFAHGLSAEPSEVEVWMKCTTAVQGYSEDDVIKPLLQLYLIIRTDSTNVYLRTRNNFYLYLLTNLFVFESTDESKWDLQIRAKV